MLGMFKRKSTTGAAPPKPALNTTPTTLIASSNSLFLSHKQVEWGDRCFVLATEYKDRKLADVWYDMNQDLLTRPLMEQGVRDSAIFVLFASPKLAESFALYELQEALFCAKPIAVIVDLDVCSPNYVDYNIFVKRVYKAITAVSRKDEAIKDMSFGEFQKRMGAPIPFHRHFGAARDEMFKAIHSRGGDSQFDPAQHPPAPAFLADRTKALHRAEILLVGHAYTGMDQCDLISVELSLNGFRAHSLDPHDDLPAVLSTGKSMCLVVFLTNQTLLQQHVVQAVKLAKQCGKTVIFMYEGNAGRSGAQAGLSEIASQAKDDIFAGMLNVEEIIIFDQSTRRNYKDGFIQLLLRRAKMQIPLAKPQFDPFDVPSRKLLQMQPNSRQWFCNKVDSFAKTTSNTTVFLIAADAGLGKSVLMANLARRGHETFAAHQSTVLVPGAALVGAMHFFESSDVHKRSAENALVSISIQLCKSVNGFRSLLPKDAQQQVDEAKGNLEALLNLLVLHPASKLTEQPPSSAILVLLDAMDECTEAFRLTSALNKHWDTAPQWLKLVVSTRPSEEILIALKKFQPESIDSKDPNHVNDLREYLVGILTTSLGIKQPQQLDAIVNKLLALSEGSFLYVAMQVEHLVKLAELGELTVDKISTFPQGMEEAYRRGFERLYEDLENDEDEYHQVLTVAVLISRVPMLETIWVQWLNTSRSAYPKSLRRKLGRVLQFTANEIKAPHKSLVDFLQDTEDAKCASRLCPHLHLQVTPELHGQIADCLMVHCSRVYEGFKANAKLPEQLSSDERFALEHMVFHLAKAGNVDAINKLFIDFTRLLLMVTFVQEQSGLHGILRLVQDVAKSEAPVSQQVEAVLGVLRLGAPALAFNPVELAGQVLGRLQNGETHPLALGAKQWAQAKRKSGTLVALPFNATCSGLSAADAGLVKLRYVGHKESVYAVDVADVVSLTCSSDTTCRIWDAQTGESLQVYTGHTTPVQCGRLLSKGSVALTGDDAGDIRLWKVCPSPLDDKIDLFVFVGHQTWVMSLCVNSNQTQFVSGDYDGKAIVWDLIAKTKLHELTVSDQQLAVWFDSVDSGGSMFFSSADTIQVWAGQECKSTFELGSDVKCFTVSMDALYVALDDRALRKLSKTSGAVQVETVTTSPACCIAISNAMLAVGFRASDAALFDANTLTFLHRLEAHTCWVSALAFSLDGKSLLSGSWDHYALTWTIPTTTVAASTAVAKTGHEKHDDYVTCVNILPEKLWVATGSADKRVRVWDLNTGLYFASFEAGFVAKRVGFVSDRIVVCQNESGSKSRAWDLATMTVVDSAPAMPADHGRSLGNIENHVDLGLDGAVSFTQEDSGVCVRKNQYLIGPHGNSFRVWTLS